MKYFGVGLMGEDNCARQMLALICHFRLFCKWHSVNCIEFFFQFTTIFMKSIKILLTTFLLVWWEWHLQTFDNWNFPIFKIECPSYQYINIKTLAVTAYWIWSIFLLSTPNIGHIRNYQNFVHWYVLSEEKTIKKIFFCKS